MGGFRNWAVRAAWCAAVAFPACGVAQEDASPREAASRALAWLAAHQLPNGAWGQGEESEQMGRGEGLRDLPNVADTCMAATALIHAGSTPSEGPHAQALARAVAYVCGEVEGADEESIAVTAVRGTRVQAKIGENVDTFLAANLLAEVRNAMPDEVSAQRVSAALDKVMRKIARHQQGDGGWQNRGWAGALGGSLAVRGINRAAQQGAAVPAAVLAAAERNAQGKFDVRSGGFDAGESAGVELYAAASTLGAMQASDETNRQREGALRETAADAAAPAETREAAAASLRRIDESREGLARARAAVTGRLQDAAFVDGFGSNGGEEFLSYFTIGESLAHQGGEAWRTWRDAMGANLSRIQNADGSFSGHHCITGRTFCTAAALQVLSLRESSPLSAEAPQR